MKREFRFDYMLVEILIVIRKQRRWLNSKDNFTQRSVRLGRLMIEILIVVPRPFI